WYAAGEAASWCPSSRRTFQVRLPHDLPGFLSPGGVAAPAVGLKLFVFIFQGSFKSPTVHGKGDHIGSSEGTLEQSSPEEFIHHSVPNDPNLPFLFLLRWGGMRCHNDAHEGAILGEA